jgi:predicted RecA/RadA family phage recombinase
MSKEAYLVREDGRTMQYVNNSATAVSAGEVVNISIGANQGILAVAQQAIAAATSDTTHSGTVCYEGVFDLTNAGNKSFALGAIVNWAPSSNYVTDATTTGIYNAGICVRKSDSTADSFVSVDLNEGPKEFYVYS